jgi:large subunit ribosomal protein L3
MTIGLIGKKCGMTRVFTEAGDSIPVTVINVSPNKITQIKTMDSDGYLAIQVTFGNKKASRVNKPLTGHFAKAGVEPGECLWEFRLENENEMAELKVASELTVDLFTPGQFVDVKGVSKGKGFAGVIKRHNFSMQDATHGNSLSHRVHGSIGQRQTPGRVFKGKKMAGRMGGENCTIQNLQVVKIDKERNLLLIKGAIPGAPGGRIVVLPAIKKSKK